LRSINWKKLFGTPWFKFLVAAGVLFALVAGGRIRPELFGGLSGNWEWLLLAFVLMLPTYLIVSLRFLVVLRNQGVAVGFREALAWTMIGSFFDVAMPSSSGGDLVKATYIFRDLRPGFRTQGLMAIFFDRVLGLLGLFLLAVLTMLIGWKQLAHLPGSREIFIFLCLTIVATLLFFVLAGSRKISQRLHLSNVFQKIPLSGKLIKLSDCFRSLLKRPGDLMSVFALSVLNHICWCSALLCVVFSFGQSVNPFIGFTVFPLAIFSNMFGFAGGFGVGTAAFDFIFSRLLDIHIGAVIGLTFQSLSAASRLTGLPFYLRRGTKPE